MSEERLRQIQALLDQKGRRVVASDLCRELLVEVRRLRQVPAPARIEPWTCPDCGTVCKRGRDCHRTPAGVYCEAP